MALENWIILTSAKSRAWKLFVDIEIMFTTN